MEGTRDQRASDKNKKVSSASIPLLTREEREVEMESKRDYTCEKLLLSRFNA